MIHRKQLISESTGEVFLTSDTKFTESMNEEGYRFPAHKAGIRLFADVPYPNEMTDAEIGKITRLSRYYMVGGANMLGYRRGKEIAPYTADEITMLAKLKPRQGQAFIRKMLSLHVFLRVSTHSGVQFYINPVHGFSNGQRLSLDLFLLFQKEVASLLPAWVIRDFLSQAKARSSLATMPSPDPAYSPALSFAEDILKEKSS